MTEYIHLVGAEDVQRAAGRISSAADTMSNAASSIEGSLEMFLRQFEQLVCRLEEVEMGHSAELAARLRRDTRALALSYSYAITREHDSCLAYTGA